MDSLTKLMMLLIFASPFHTACSRHDSTYLVDPETEEGLAAPANLGGRGTSPDDTAPFVLPRGPRTAGSCDLPVPDHLTIQTPIWGLSPVHFYIPHPTWALAVAHAALLFSDLTESGLALRLSPSFVLATALKESFLGCDETTAADPRHPESAYLRSLAADHDGCFQMEDGTAWLELTRMFPRFAGISHAAVISAEGQASRGHANFETGALALAYYDTFAYAMLPGLGLSDPDAWFTQAKDPQALPKVVALLYNRGAWASEVQTAVRACQDRPIEECVPTNTPGSDYIRAVSAYTAELEAAVASDHCYDETLSTEVIATYLERIAPMFPGEDWPALHKASQAAFLEASGGKREAPFQQVARPVLQGLVSGMQAKLRCPDQARQEWYGRRCPQ